MLKKWKTKDLYRQWEIINRDSPDPPTFEEYQRWEERFDRYVKHRRAGFNTVTLRPDEVPCWTPSLIENELGPITLQRHRETVKVKFTNLGWLTSRRGYRVLLAATMVSIAALIFYTAMSWILDFEPQLTLQLVLIIISVGVAILIYATVGRGRAIEVNRYPLAAETFRYLLDTLGEDSWPRSAGDAQGAWRAYSSGEVLLRVGTTDDSDADKFFHEARSLADGEARESTDRSTK